MGKGKILILDDDPVVSMSCERILGSEGFSISTIDRGQDALKLLDREAFDLLITDIRLPDMNGMTVLREAKASHPEVDVVIITAYPTLTDAKNSIRLGAAEYIEKPFTPDFMISVAKKVIEGRRGALKKTFLEQFREYIATPGDSEVLSRHRNGILTDKYGFDELIGVSPSMQKVFGLIKKAAASESNVLITGESGTGKELVARAIHRWSPRCEGPFIPINCSAIPDGLFESELFGFEKGSFTGANYTKKGLLELADRGTVFFDEIGDVSPVFQTKILRVLQEGVLMRVGGVRQIKIDERIIAATNKDLMSACQKGTFREDLLYRLDVIDIHLPPLSERLEDVPLLVKHFVKKHATKRKGVLIKKISRDAMNILMTHSYRGNVRELENIIERAIAFANSTDIIPPDLPPYLLRPLPGEKTSPTRLKGAIEALEKELITSALREAGGNVSKAAAALGMYRQQLQRKIKALRIAT